MIFFYLLVPHCIYLWYSTTFYQPTAYTNGTLLSSTGQCLYQWNSAIFYWLSANPYVTLLSSTGSLPIPMVLYYILMASYSTTFYWRPAHTYGSLLSPTDSLRISMVLFYLLLAYCLYLWYFTTVYLPTAYPFEPPIPMVLYDLLLATCRSLWYIINIYWLPAYPYGSLPLSTGDYGILLPFSGHLPIHMVLYNLLLAPCLSI